MAVRRRPRSDKPAPLLPSERRAAVTDGHTGTWLGQGGTAVPSGVVWLIRPMPDGQWPPDQRAPRDDSFSWLVRSHCGHPGGAKLWAFYKLEDAQTYEQVFRASPCHYTRCQDPKRRRS